MRASFIGRLHPACLHAADGSHLQCRRASAVGGGIEQRVTFAAAKLNTCILPVAAGDRERASRLYRHACGVPHRRDAVADRHRAGDPLGDVDSDCRADAGETLRKCGAGGCQQQPGDHQDGRDGSANVSGKTKYHEILP